MERERKKKGVGTAQKMGMYGTVKRGASGMYGKSLSRGGQGLYGGAADRTVEHSVAPARPITAFEVERAESERAAQASGLYSGFARGQQGLYAGASQGHRGLYAGAAEDTAEFGVSPGAHISSADVAAMRDAAEAERLQLAEGLYSGLSGEQGLYQGLATKGEGGLYAGAARKGAYSMAPARKITSAEVAAAETERAQHAVGMYSNVYRNTDGGHLYLGQKGAALAKGGLFAGASEATHEFSVNPNRLRAQPEHSQIVKTAAHASHRRKGGKKRPPVRMQVSPSYDGRNAFEHTV